jgi:hypothetical protein
VASTLTIHWSAWVPEGVVAAGQVECMAWISTVHTPARLGEAVGADGVGLAAWATSAPRTTERLNMGDSRWERDR